MNPREGRIVLAGMAVGAVVAGLVVWFMRARAVGPAQSGSIASAVKLVRWPDLLRIGAAGIALARQIASLSQAATEDRAHH